MVLVKMYKIIFKLSNEKWIKIGITFGDSTNIVKGIPQGSILSLLLFNIFINELFFFSAKWEICYFADANSFHSCGMNLDNMFTDLNVYEWFMYSSMKANPENF